MVEHWNSDSGTVEQWNSVVEQCEGMKQWNSNGGKVTVQQCCGTVER